MNKFNLFITLTFHFFMDNDYMTLENNAKAGELVEADVLADKLNVSRNTILNWAKKGEIPAIKIGRIYRFSLIKIAQHLNHEI